METSLLSAGILGFIEFKSGVGMTYGDERDDAYDFGRDLAHRLTFRRWDYSL